MSNPNTERRVYYLDARTLADVFKLSRFYGGHVFESAIIRRAVAVLAEHAAGLDGESPEAAEERAAVLAFVRPRRRADA